MSVKRNLYAKTTLTLQKAKPRMLVICTGNSCRSQMAEGFLRDLTHGKVEVFSAGTHPTYVHPIAIRVMKEIGIDMSQHSSKSAELFKNEELDYVITVCDHAREVCPTFPGAKKIFHTPFDDPVMFFGEEENRLSKFRQVRDQIRTSMNEFVKKELKKEGTIAP